MGAFENGALGVIITITSIILILCSGFFWYFLSLSVGIPEINGFKIALITDITHGVVLVVTGFFGLMTTCAIVFPVFLILHVILSFVVAVGIIAEVALYFTVLDQRCDVSILGYMFCFGFGTGDLLGAELAISALAVPLVISLVSAILGLVLCVTGSKSDEYYFDD